MQLLNAAAEAAINDIYSDGGFVPVKLHRNRPWAQVADPRPKLLEFLASSWQKGKEKAKRRYTSLNAWTQT